MPDDTSEGEAQASTDESQLLDAESLFNLLRQTLNTYGSVFDNVAVATVSFDVTPWDGEVDLEGVNGWRVVAECVGYNDLKEPEEVGTAEDEDEVEEKTKKLLEQVEPEQTFDESWVGTGETLVAALQVIRNGVQYALEEVVSQRRAEVAKADQALVTLRQGVVLEKMWTTAPELHDPENQTEEENAREAAQVQAQDGQTPAPNR